MYGSDYDPGGMSQLEGVDAAQTLADDANATPATQPIGGVLQLRHRVDASQDHALPDHSQLVLAFQQAGTALRDQAGRLALVRVPSFLTLMPFREFLAHCEEICGEFFGAEPLMITDANSGVLAWEASLPLTTGANSMLVNTARSAEEDAFRFIRCWACEPYMGRRDERCSAQETLPMNLPSKCEVCCRGGGAR